MKTFIMILLMTGTDWHLHVMEPVRMSTREICLDAGREYAIYKEKFMIEKGSDTKTVTFIDCHEGTLFSRERPWKAE